jgi:hypothetical protein
MTEKVQPPIEEYKPNPKSNSNNKFQKNEVCAIRHYEMISLFIIFRLVPVSDVMWPDSSGVIALRMTGHLNNRERVPVYWRKE